MGPGCWSVESYLLTPPLNQVKNASSSFLFAFFCILPFLKDPWILEILTWTAQGRALLWNSPPHSLPTDLLRWRFCTSAVMFKDEKILKRVVVVVYCFKALSSRLKLLVAALLLSQLWVAEYIILTIFISILSSSWYRNPTCSSYVNYHHQLLNLILLNNSLSITQCFSPITIVQYLVLQCKYLIISR